MAAHTADALRQLNVLAAVYTGCASFRNQALQQWPSAGPTDVYGSVEAHRAMVAAQLATGVLLDDSMFYTDARISTRYPTVEVRIADVYLDEADSTLIGALTRGLVETSAHAWKADEEAPAGPSRLVRRATWRASRSAVHGPFVASPDQSTSVGPRHRRPVPGPRPAGLGGLW